MWMSLRKKPTRRSCLFMWVKFHNLVKKRFTKKLSLGFSVAINSEKIAKKIHITFLFSQFIYSQIWLSLFMDDCHLSSITKLLKKTETRGVTSQTKHVQNGVWAFKSLTTTSNLYYPITTPHGDINCYHKLYKHTFKKYHT